MDKSKESKLFCWFKKTDLAEKVNVDSFGSDVFEISF